MKRNKSYPLPLYFIGKVLKDSNNKFGSLKHDYYLFLMDKENSNECYAISYENGTYWFEKETGLLIKSTKENTKLYTYYNNCVNDKMVEPPDTTGLEIHNVDN